MYIIYYIQAYIPYATSARERAAEGETEGQIEHEGSRE